jgi:hypothetical protein
VSATYTDPMRMLRRITAAAYSSAVREYRRERVTMVRREVKRETDEEIRAAVRGEGIITTVATD